MIRSVVARWAGPTSTMLLAAACASACGGKAVIDGDGSAGGGGSTSTTTNSSSSTTGGGTLSIRLLDILVSANCQPVVAPDPLRVTFSLDLDNNSSLPAEAIMVSAGLKGAPGATTFDVTPSTSGTVAAGTMIEMQFSKVEDSAVGTPGCNWCMATNARLVLEVDVSGQNTVLDEPVASVSCTF